jgi:hypothetical protein
VHLLGPLYVALDDVAVQEWPSARCRSLFGYLLTHREPWPPREVLMEAFWPESSPEASRNSLNVAIHALRRTLRSVTDMPVVVHGGGVYRINTDLCLWLDFESAIAAPPAGPAETPGETPAAAAAEPAAETPPEAPSAPRRSGPASSAVLSVERTALRAGEPFTMTVAIAFAAPPQASRLAYSALVVARPLAGGPKRTVAPADGLLATGSSTISIESAGLPSGGYRLDGAVSLREPGGDRPVRLAALVEGLLVQVVPG